MDYNYQSVKAHFISRFEKKPILVRSPGRINLIGEHTDYNGGFVMPAAIDKEIVFAIADSDDDTSQVVALNFDEAFEFDLRNPQPIDSPMWANYLLGVARQLVDSGFQLKPFVCVFGGSIPSGAGLSSSAALECGFACALQEINSLSITRSELARIAQWSEHNFVGVRCGIMDQFANMMGKRGNVLKLDCRSLAYDYHPLSLDDHSIVLFNTGVKHTLASSEYNTRRIECEEGVRILHLTNPLVTSLRDVTIQMLDRSDGVLPKIISQRCRYVVEEIERVQLASHDLQLGDIRAIGKRMFQTHAGLSNLYQVSCKELDFLVDMVRLNPQVLGARLMGGGFGGCTINIIERAAVDEIIENVSRAFKLKFNMDIDTYSIQITDGTSVIVE